MSTLIKRGNIYHYQWCINGKAKRKSLKTSDLSTAKRLQTSYDARLLQLKTGTAPARSRVSDGLAGFLEAKRATLKPGTIQTYDEHSRALAGWLERIGVAFWHQLTPAHVEAFVGEQMALAAPKTVWNRIGVLRACLNWLWRSGRIDTLPIRQWPHIKKISKHPDRLQHYSADEIRQLAAYFQGKPFFPVFRFACYTGARRDEIRNARVGDVLLGDGSIRLHSVKTESSSHDQIRVVEIAEALRPILEERTRGRRPEEFLFPEFLEHSRNWPHVQMQQACSAIGIGYKRFHGLRHSYASYLLDGGEDILRVMDAMGHRRLETTQRYLHRVRRADVSKLGY